jgi:hypothetical protein
MSEPEDYWKQRAMNPEAFGGAEKKLWMEIEPLLFELFDELKDSDKIETVYTLSEIHHIEAIGANLNNVSLSHNVLMDLGGNLERAEDFIKITSQFGYDEPKVTHQLIAISVILSILNTESFKNFVLFHLKDVNHEASKFSNTMEHFAPMTWRKLRPYVYNKFRNSLAHGSWAIEEKLIVLFDDAKLIPYEKLTLADFIIKTKQQNILYSCLSFVINEEIKKGFFR